MLEKLAPYISNNVLSLKKLKDTNYPLYKYISTYKDSYQSVDILDDTKVVKGYKEIKKYLKHYYGDEVNISEIRKTNINLYNYIAAIGKPEEVISEMGFSPTYEGKTTKYSLIKELNEYSKEGKFKALPKYLYNKVYYQATKNKMTVWEYLDSLGFSRRY